jgi:hypothetical protein
MRLGRIQVRGRWRGRKGRAAREEDMGKQRQEEKLCLGDWLELGLSGEEGVSVPLEENWEMVATLK